MLSVAVLPALGAGDSPGAGDPWCKEVIPASTSGGPDPLSILLQSFPPAPHPLFIFTCVSPTNLLIRALSRLFTV